MSDVVLMCGPAGSGKSTYARALEADGYARLSLDAAAWSEGHAVHPLPADLSERFHAELRARLVALVTAGSDVVVDLSFWSRTSRDEYRDLLAPLGVTPLTVYLATPRDVVLERLARRRGEGPDDVLVTEETALRYLAAFEVPDPEEGPLRVVGA